MSRERKPRARNGINEKILEKLLGRVTATGGAWLLSRINYAKRVILNASIMAVLWLDQVSFRQVLIQFSLSPLRGALAVIKHANNFTWICGAC